MCVARWHLHGDLLTSNAKVHIYLHNLFFSFLENKMSKSIFAFEIGIYNTELIGVFTALGFVMAISIQTAGPTIMEIHLVYKLRPQNDG